MYIKLIRSFDTGLRFGYIMMKHTPGYSQNKVKNIIIYLCIAVVGISLFRPEAKAQTDASIKKAKTTVSDADRSLKKYQKFSKIDSVPWLLGGDAALSFSATSLANWAAGGEDQIGVSPIVNLYANYKKGKRTLENYATFAYGILKSGDRKAVKSDDRIYLTTKAGYQLSTKWYYAAAILARTQFAPGYKYTAKDTIRVSDFLAPLYLYASVGLDYRPNKNFSSVFSPIMGRATYARSDDMNVLANAGLVETEKDADGKDVKVPHNSRYEFGGGVIMSLNGDILKKKITYSSQLELFSNYVVKPENVDVTWMLQAKIMLYKNITADLRLDVKYDDDQKATNKETGQLEGPKTQVKNYLGVGLFYQF